MPLNAAEIEILDRATFDGAPFVASGSCRVNGEPASLISLGCAASSTLTVTIEVDEDRVHLDEDNKQIHLDDQAVLVEPYGYRPDPWRHTVRLDLQAKSLRISAREE